MPPPGCSAISGGGGARRERRWVKYDGIGPVDETGLPLASRSVSGGGWGGGGDALLDPPITAPLRPTERGSAPGLVPLYVPADPLQAAR